MVTPFLERMFKEGLLSGIEVAQSDFIHPAAMDVALKYNLYIAATTDAHLGTTMEQEAAGMDHRVTTLFLTRGDDESAFKDAWKSVALSACFETPSSAPRRTSGP